jgi:ABC-type uncharacterized transport system permease subunit
MFVDPVARVLQIDPDPVILVVTVFVLALIFVFYLLLRRTVLGFREGLDQGRRER